MAEGGYLNYLIDVCLRLYCCFLIICWVNQVALTGTDFAVLFLLVLLSTLVDILLTHV